VRNVYSSAEMPTVHLNMLRALKEVLFLCLVGVTVEMLVFDITVEVLVGNCEANGDCADEPAAACTGLNPCVKLEL
jgi:hypothetical protein